MSTGRETSRIDRTGDVYGRLTVLRYAGPNKWRQATWLCRCDCGTEKVVGGSQLTSGLTRSCGCLQRETAAALNRKRPGVAGYNALLRQYKHQAQNRGYEFRLTKEDFSFLTQMNCYYCGAEPAQESWAGSGCVEPYIYNGIDRVDSSEGYFMDNVVPCCKRCNWMKREMSLGQFLGHIARIHDRRVQRVNG